MAAAESVLKHFNRIEGQVRGIGKMLEEERNCTEIIQQIIAARSSLSSLGVTILRSDMQTCLKQGASEDFENKITQLFKIS